MKTTEDSNLVVKQVSTKIVKNEFDEFEVFAILYNRGEKKKSISYFTDDLNDAKTTSIEMAKELLTKG